jgi:hypothetical protein
MHDFWTLPVQEVAESRLHGRVSPVSLLVVWKTLIGDDPRDRQTVLHPPVHFQRGLARRQDAREHCDVVPSRSVAQGQLVALQRGATSMLGHVEAVHMGDAHLDPYSMSSGACGLDRSQD